MRRIQFLPYDKTPVTQHVSPLHKGKKVAPILAAHWCILDKSCSVAKYGTDFEKPSLGKGVNLCGGLCSSCKIGRHVELLNLKVIERTPIRSLGC